MLNPLLMTKLYIPPQRHELVPRSRLLGLLNEGLKRKMILVSAPAGFGKTTLLSEWVWQGEVPVAWVSLDADDNDLARFLAYVVTALRTVEPGISRTLAAILQSPHPPPAESVLIALINDCVDLPVHCALVLDDYHVINAQPVHDALTFLLDHVPPNLHLVIVTRADPPLPLARLRGRGQVTELRSPDLRFTPDEAAEFLKRVMGLELSTDNVAALVNRTEGWIAGLQMAALSMQERKDVAGFIQAFSGSHRYILDYLVEEVLRRQPEGIQSFLFQTSILDRLTGSLCDAVTGQENSQSILESLERANLFLLSLDDERHWFRYHRLFADLLRQRLHQAQTDLIPQLHRRASDWYERNELIAAAIDHTLAGGDYERAASMIEDCAETLWEQGELTSLSNWLEVLPDELIRSRSQLCIIRAWTLFSNGQYQAAEQYLAAAKRVIGSAARATEQEGKVASIRALIASFQGNIPGIIQFADQALECLPEENATWRGAVAIALGTAHTFNGDMGAARRAYEQAAMVSKDAGNAYLNLNANMRLALNHWNQGQLRKASEICQQQLELLHESGLSETSLAGALFGLLGNIWCEWGDLERALNYGQKGLALTKRGESAGAAGLSHLALVRVLFSKQDVVGATSVLQKAEQLTRKLDMPIWIMSGIVAWRARLWIAQGRYDKAARLLQERGLYVDSDVPYFRANEQLALVRLLIAQDKTEDALGLLDRMYEKAETKGLAGLKLVVLVLYALAHQAEGNGVQALASLAQALSLAEPEGFFRVFVDEGPPIAQLLYEAAAQGISPEYSGRLLTAFSVVTPGEPATPRPLHGNLVEPLSKREIEVLQLIADGLTNREISQQLVLSLSTVKVHTYNIYGKLSVNNRIQAVSKARSLGILPGL